MPKKRAEMGEMVAIFCLQEEFFLPLSRLGNEVVNLWERSVSGVVCAVSLGWKTGLARLILLGQRPLHNGGIAYSMPK